MLKPPQLPTITSLLPSFWRDCCSVAQSCPTLSNPMDCSTPGLPAHHQLPELAQTQVHRVSDSIQPSRPLSSPSPFCLQSFPASGSFPLSQLFASDGQSYGSFRTAGDRTKEPVPERSLKGPIQARRNSHMQDFQGMVSKVDNCL